MTPKKTPAARSGRRAASTAKRPAKKVVATKKPAVKKRARRQAPATPPPPLAGETVVAALERDLAEIGKLPKGSGSLVASAFALARELDAKNSATSKSMCARAFREALDRLREIAPLEREPDAVDELAARRTRRRARAATS